MLAVQTMVRDKNVYWPTYVTARERSFRQPTAEQRCNKLFEDEYSNNR